FMRFKADLPLNYVRREDYIRGQTVIEAKLDDFTTNWKWYSSTAIPEVNNGRYYPGTPRIPALESAGCPEQNPPL
ncbi:hypothetical protein MLL02_26285, partial [Escherichia coli]|nr:hypothetical protein [Escherichia coli]